MPIVEKKKDLSFDDLADPVKWRSRDTARKTNLKNYTITDTKYQNGLHKQIIL